MMIYPRYEILKKSRVIVALTFYMSLIRLEEYKTIVFSDLASFQNKETMKEWAYFIIKDKLNEIFTEIITYKGKKPNAGSDNITYMKEFLEINTEFKYDKTKKDRLSKSYKITRFSIWKYYFYERYTSLMKKKELEGQADAFFICNQPVKKDLNNIDNLADHFTNMFMEDLLWCIKTCGELVYLEYHKRQEIVKICDPKGFDLNYIKESGNEKLKKYLENKTEEEIKKYA